jgi:hypothetical protein
MWKNTWNQSKQGDDMLLTREQIDKADDLKRETVLVEEWGGEVIVRAATSIEREEYNQSVFRPQVTAGKSELKPDFRNSEAKLVVKCLIYENGERMYSDAEATKLGQKSSTAIRALFNVVARLSGMDSESRKRAEKNSEETPSDSSASDSLLPSGVPSENSTTV